MEKYPTVDIVSFDGNLCAVSFPGAAWHTDSDVNPGRATGGSRQRYWCEDCSETFYRRNW